MDQPLVFVKTYLGAHSVRIYLQRFNAHLFELVEPSARLGSERLRTANTKYRGDSVGRQSKSTKARVARPKRGKLQPPPARKFYYRSGSLEALQRGNVAGS